MRDGDRLKSLFHVVVGREGRYDGDIVGGEREDPLRWCHVRGTDNIWVVIKGWAGAGVVVT